MKKNEKEKKCIKCVYYKQNSCNNINIEFKSNSVNMAENCSSYRLKSKFKKYKNRNIVRR